MYGCGSMSSCMGVVVRQHVWVLWYVVMYGCGGMSSCIPQQFLSQRHEILETV